MTSTHHTPHDDAIAQERSRRCTVCQGSGIRLDFMVSGMRVVVPCECPRGAIETTVCEIGNPRAHGERDPSRHRRPSNIVGRPKTNAEYWSRVRQQEEVLADLHC